MYTEHGSKNRSGGLAQLKVENKSVLCYAVPDKVPQCLIFCLIIILANYLLMTLRKMFYIAENKSTIR